MARRAENRKTYPNVPMQYFLQKCRDINNGGLNVSLKSENPEADGRVWFRVLHGMTMTSYGEKITITLRPMGAGTDVHILSECGMPTQLVDYGKNRQNCEAVFAYLERGIEVYTQPRQAVQAPQQAAPFTQGAPAAPAAAPVSFAAQDFVFCTECGTKNSKGSRFCMNCGTKLMILG